MAKDFEDGKWYVAYAVHRWADTDDIDPDYTFSTEEEAREFASRLRCDDDNTRCFFRKNGRWFTKEPEIYYLGDSLFSDSAIRRWTEDDPNVIIIE